MKNYKEITTTELASLRRQLFDLQSGCCAICGNPLGENTTNQHVDHQHCFKSEELGTNGAGLVRGLLCRNCNALEGKIWNSIHRFQNCNTTEPVESRIEFLEKLILYYKDNYQNQNPVLHPKERRPQKISKSEYNKIKKWFNLRYANCKKKRKFPGYPKSGNITKSLAKLKEECKAETCKPCVDTKSAKPK